jgi:hypothetical protein
MALRISLSVACELFLVAAAVAQSAPPAKPVDFAREIRPILSDKCFFCHGPDEKHREAELRLDLREGLFRSADEVTIVAPGKPEASEIWRRISAESEDERMPPVESGKSLTDSQRALIRRWIEQGAQWQEHWSFKPLTRPVVPEVKSGRRPVNDVDRFWLARLQQEGFEPSPPANPRTLMRRYSFDLIGLPPRPEEVEAFVAGYELDADAACAAAVDRLLDSPHFGERLAIYWLDLVRYADTVGYHGDQEHAISPYRDYVIQSFNDNVPFDRFTAEQLAGDLLDPASVDCKIASGYNRLLQTSHEGGVQQREYLAKYSADRVRNVSSVWLGLTFGCAECHDHKYDPIQQRDFYRLAAFFADVDDYRSFKGVDITPTKRDPEIEALSGLERLTLAELEAELNSVGAAAPDQAEERRANHQRRIDALRAKKRRTMITESIEPRPIRVLARGDWMDETGEIVEPGVPAIFRQIEPPDMHPHAADRPNRLALASWLMNKDHPLTARVFVNRLWKLYFGRGLAASLDDLGSQGEPPTHPELLDWLASEFAENEWNIKHVIRLMVLSQAYRQSSLETPEMREKDPLNRLLSRQARPRLEAELVRDNALAISGLLVSTIGGPSSHPYQPEGYYAHLNFPKRTYTADQDQQQYRRGVYTHWQRSYLHPMLKAFDAPSREECTAERPVSNTPQAALVLLNDPTFLEAARVFAVRILNEGGESANGRLRWAWWVALSREPTPRELSTLARLLRQDLAEFEADASAAEELLKVGMAPVPVELNKVEVAAWTSVARAIFNLNEFITRN